MLNRKISSAFGMINKMVEKLSAGIGELNQEHNANVEKIYDLQSRNENLSEEIRSARKLKENLENLKS